MVIKRAIKFAMRAAVTGLKRKATDADKSSTSTWESYKRGLQSEGKYFELKAEVGLPSFLTTSEQVQAAASVLNRNESYLVAFLTPHLNAKLIPVLPAEYTLINVEKYSRMPQSSEPKETRLTPDQLICPHYLVCYR